MKTKNILLVLTLISSVNLFSQATASIIDDDFFRVRLTLSGDIDGDGDEDVIASSNANQKVVWYENLDGLGNFGEAILITTQEVGVTAIEIVDLDGDNDLDLVISSNSGDESLGMRIQMAKPILVLPM